MPKERYSCSALSHLLGVVGYGNHVMHSLTALGEWAAKPLQCTASLPGRSGRWNSCNAPPRCPGAVGSATPATHCLTTWGQRAVELMQCTASLPGGSGQCNSCNACHSREQQLPTARVRKLGGRGVLPRWSSVPTEFLHGTAVPKLPRGISLRGRGFLPRRRSVLTEGLRGMAVPKSPVLRSLGGRGV